MATARNLIKNALKYYDIRFLELNTNGGTGTDLINAAFSKIRVKGSNQTLSSNHLSIGLDRLNDLILNLQYDGIDLGYTALASDADPTNLPDWSLFSIKSLLAVSLAGEYGKEIDQSLQSQAVSASETLKERTDTTLMEDGLQTLIDMLAEWDGVGVNLGYIRPDTVSDETEIPLFAEFSVISNLANRLGPKTGRPVRVDLKALSTEAYNNMINKLYGDGIFISYPAGLPTGAGNHGCSGTGRRFYGDERRRNIYTEDGQTMINEVDQAIEQDAGG